MIDVHSVSDCKELIERIRRTLSARGYNTSGISGTPKPFPLHNDDVLEALSEAILTRQANWSSIKGILPALKASFSNYNINSVARLTDSQIQSIANQYKSKVKARFFEEEVFAIRSNARRLQQIGSVCTFIKNYLSGSAYDASCGCYIRPNDAGLLHCFVHHDSPHKLDCVGLPICCEFFNNIGVDEFKPDVHTISFLNRIDLDRSKVNVSRKPDGVREIGVRIAATLRKPRRYVDSYMWVLCAEGEGEICTEDDPKCISCWLKIKEPMFCKGFPSKAGIVSNPVGAARRFKECNLHWKDASRKMEKAGLAPANIQSIITTVYSTTIKRVPMKRTR